MGFEEQYLTTLAQIMGKNESTKNSRDGEYHSTTRMIGPVTLAWDLKDGMPLLTTRKCPHKSASVELEGFIKGITQREWYQERNCKFWDQWEGPIVYPHAWRNYGGEIGKPYSGGFDQLESIVDTLKTSRGSRRAVCVNFTPHQNDLVSLPACHIAWGVNSNYDGRLDLWYCQRSCDFLLGSNVWNYSLLLHLLSHFTGYTPGRVTSFFVDCHVYENQFEAARELLSREIKNPLPKIEINTKATRIQDWSHKEYRLIDYAHQGPIRIPITE